MDRRRCLPRRSPNVRRKQLAGPDTSSACYAATANEPTVAARGLGYKSPLRHARSRSPCSAHVDNAFLGAIRTNAGQEDYRAGFEAGARSIDPDIEILATYLDDFGYRQERGLAATPYDTPEGGRFVADLIYDAGADVIFHVAGRSGSGVLDAAARLSRNDLWVIGSETDEWRAADTRQRAHVLTSILRRYDLQTYTVIDDDLDGSLDSGVRQLTAADGMMTYAESGDALSADARAHLDRAIEQLASGSVELPRRAGAPTMPEELIEPGTGTGLIFGAQGALVHFAVPSGWEADGALVRGPGDPNVAVLFLDVANIYADPCQWTRFDPPVGPTVDDLVSALQQVPAFDVTAPRDLTVDGFNGKYLEFTFDRYDEAACRQGKFGLWEDTGVGGPNPDGSPHWWAQGPEQTTRVWILDVAGTRLVMAGFDHPTTPGDPRAAIDEIINSIQIG